MMLTDTLTETCDAIEEYLVEYPETYAHCIAEIRAVYDAIVALRRKLEEPLLQGPALEDWLDSLPDEDVPDEELAAIVARIRQAQEEGTL